ncbi:McrC family protein [Spirosoma oryzicola]|uniref:McrC family protein n=1 Tax=Spirosoma oryzicola TaxID=2898794 RepID=UPI001E2C7A17|nr:McrC family protein [Spirosoma oryzicola]UHG89191.1 McrC family protein [Spirosoma oryzicola]
MPSILSVAENGLIGKETDRAIRPGPSADVSVTDAVFEALRQLAVDAEGVDGLLTFFVQKGREYVRVRKYVGLVTLPDGTQLEILPKIGRGATSRSMLLSMLRHLQHGPFRTLSSAHTNATHLPLWEVFVTAFLDALESLVQQGLQRSYVSVESNERFWKGRFQSTRQQRENAQHAERLAVVYDVLTADVAPNRILKTTLHYLQQRNHSAPVQQRIRQLDGALDGISACGSVQDDLKLVKRSNRLFARYELALRWAEALLGRRAYGVKVGLTADLSLLFPMERVFEDYVSHGIRRYWPEADKVTVQESLAHLVDEHAGMPKFKLRPDIVIEHSDRKFVLDMKWKEVTGTDHSGSYGIDHADLYQLFAYGKKYEASDLFLVYPANETFQQPLPVFGYDSTTRLHVVPFDVLNPLVNEVEKLADYALSFQ